MNGPPPDPNSAVWNCETFAQNQNANAIRCGTLYNFRFDSTAPPATSTANIVSLRQVRQFPFQSRHLTCQIRPRRLPLQQVQPRLPRPLRLQHLLPLPQHRYSYRDSHSYGYAYGNGHRDSYTHSYSTAYPNTKVYPGTEASPDSTAAALIRSDR